MSEQASETTRPPVCPLCGNRCGLFLCPCCGAHSWVPWKCGECREHGDPCMTHFRFRTAQPADDAPPARPR